MPVKPGGDSISIVMPVRNAAGTLPRALESILAQTFRDWQLIAVNDGSGDDSGTLLEDFSRRDPRVRVIHTPPHGIAKALQTGCADAAGRWIARMDADDVMHPERLAAQLDFAGKNPGLGE